ncbi:MAG TPA: transcription antitermination factor NusB [Kiritimatiellia bacterium]|nr:transcription antitermination factor NusB [Kiritimatiellia bacterium]
MSGRHEGRLLAVQFLFQRDINTGDLEEALNLFFSNHPAGKKVHTFAGELIRGVETNRADIDRKLQECAEHWDLHRMGGVDRNVMRVALFEMLHRQDIPPVVSINEAVDLAKELSSDESGRFVNGILDRARREINRPARAAAVVNPPVQPEA